MNEQQQETLLEMLRVGELSADDSNRDAIDFLVVYGFCALHTASLTYRLTEKGALVASWF